MWCGRKRLRVTRLLCPALLMPQVLIRALVSVSNVDHGLILLNECINPALPDSCRPDPAQMHSGRRRSSLLGEPNSRQMHLQGVPSHPDPGKFHLLVLHVGITASGLDSQASFSLQMRDHMTRSQSGQLVDGVSEVLSNVRMVSTDNVKYSGDLLAVMEVLKNSTEIFRGSKMSLSNADVEVCKTKHDGK